MVSVETLSRGDHVRSERFGNGLVELDTGAAAIVRFEHGIEECQKSTLVRIWTPRQAIGLDAWHAPLDVIVRAQAETITSINNEWGVFSRSRIALLPHQLWVCRRVLSTWPTRWLVADDVGLGKTIEAGLILWPLISNGLARRILILCKASLVDQWQYRLRTMFDIRFARYASESDGAMNDFWNTHTQVVASLETLRADRGGRHKRFFESAPWDLVLVDEAHHLNANEHGGPTLGYRLVQRMNQERLVGSMVFFTGTPHRGKDHGFLSLLGLLRPDLFDPRKSMDSQLGALRQVMIRNNKQNVTDLKGKRLFQPQRVSSETYNYSDKESAFYALLTAFIVEGKTYASSLDQSDRRLAILVLIAMQKLASSSVAAVRRALRGRLGRVVETERKLDALKARLRAEERRQLVSDLEYSDDEDTISSLQEKIISETDELGLLQDEEPRLRELVAAADEVRDETKIRRIIETVDDKFRDRSVLFFTEYKATQSLLMSALIKRYGERTVGFINGDSRAEGVIDSSGRVRTLTETRETASERFNTGGCRFLVSTEAGGEGIDLQDNCHCLIHVDLPWNPMRLHQRVGRLNRYGQKNQVEVISFYNPDTVESLIWEKLNAKIDRIQLALGSAMDEPEDLMQLILGMTSSSLFTEVFAAATDIPREALGDWFDQKTAQFGGRDVIETVRQLVGHCASFDYQSQGSQLPPVDLPDLEPFFRSMLWLNGRRVEDADESLSFRTPDAWMDEPGVRSSYEGLVFRRMVGDKDGAQKILGAGHKLVDKATRQAKAYTSCIASCPDSVLKQPLIVLRVVDRVTTEASVVHSTLLGVEVAADSQKVLVDWQLLRRLNELAVGKGMRKPRLSRPPVAVDLVAPAVEQSLLVARKHVEGLDTRYRIPMIDVLAILWPADTQPRDATGEGVPDQGDD